MQGYCPVTLVAAKELENGDPLFGLIHRRRTFLFASAKERETFLHEPDRYTPVLTGYDPMRFLKNGERVDGSPKHSLIYRGGLYLFIDEDSLQSFEENPAQAVESLQQAVALSEK
jgi:YHS domain-containing protein